MAAEMVEMKMLEMVKIVFLSLRLCRRLEKPVMPGEYELPNNQIIVMMKLIMAMMLVMMAIMMVIHMVMKVMITMVRPDWSVKHCCSQPAC